MWPGLVTSWDVEAGTKPGLTSSQGASFPRTWLLRAQAGSPAQTSGPGSRSTETSTKRRLWKSSNLGTIKGCRGSISVMKKSLTRGWGGEVGRTLGGGALAGSQGNGGQGCCHCWAGPAGPRV